MRVLNLLQKNKPIDRGTLQATFNYMPYDEVRRLGMTAETEAQLRKVNNGDGVLVVGSVLPRGSADGVLKVGDILLKGSVAQKKLSWLRRFDELESILDDNVNKKITLLVERSGVRHELELTVGDLHKISPDEYLTFSEAVVHDLSYQQARHLNRPVEGVYVAQEGYVFSRAGVPRGAVIFSVNEQLVKNIDEFEKIILSAADGEQLRLRFITFGESRRAHVAVIRMDRRWFAIQHCKKADGQSYWPCKTLDAASEEKKDKPVQVKYPEYKNEVANTLAASMVYVQFNMPFNIDGITDLHYGGAGLILDAKNGLVVTDRNTVPVAMGDVRLVFAGAIDIPAKVKFIHPLHNLAIIQYDPELLANSDVKSAEFDNETPESGDDVWMIGIKEIISCMCRK